MPGGESTDAYARLAAMRVFAVRAIDYMRSASPEDRRYLLFKFALQLYSKTSSTEAQMEGCLKMIKKPVVDDARFQRVWQNEVLSLIDSYEMNP